MLTFPYEPMPVLMSGFVTEAYRGKGYWNDLYKARLLWLFRNNSDAEYVHLYVADNNPMAEVYKRIGFEYTGEINKDNGCKWMRRKLDK